MRYLQGASFLAFWVGDRDVLEPDAVGAPAPRWSQRQLQRSRRPAAVHHEPDDLRVTSQGAAIRRAELVDGMTGLGAPEATVYEATTMMALARETGTLADLGFVADLTEHMGHPASAARAISVYIRLAQNDVDRVMTALDLISTEQLADDAGYPVVVAYWSEIVAGLRITISAADSLPNWSRWPARTWRREGSTSGRPTGTARSSTTHSASMTLPTNSSPPPSNNTRPSGRRRGSPAPTSTGRSR